MKLVTYKPFFYSAQYKGWNDVEDPNNPDAVLREWTDPVTIKCSVSNNALGELTLYTDALLQNDGLLTFLVSNKYSNPIIGETLGGLTESILVYPIGTSNGAIWRVIEGMPLLDSWGNKNRYRYRCMMVVPKQGSVTSSAPTEATNASWWS